MDKAYGVQFPQRYQAEKYRYMVEALSVSFSRLCMFTDAIGFVFVTRESLHTRGAITPHMPLFMTSPSLSNRIYEPLNQTIVQLGGSMINIAKNVNENDAKQLRNDIDSFTA